MTITNHGADGAPAVGKLSWPADGGLVTRLQGSAPPSQVLVETRVSPGEWRVTYMLDGKQYRTRQKSVAADGKTMQQFVRGVGDQGRPFEELQFFERQ